MSNTKIYLGIFRMVTFLTRVSSAGWMVNKFLTYKVTGKVHQHMTYCITREMELFTYVLGWGIRTYCIDKSNGILTCLHCMVRVNENKRY